MSALASKWGTEANKRTPFIQLGGLSSQKVVKKETEQNMKWREKQKKKVRRVG